MKIFTPFLLAFIGTHFAVFATLHSLDEWKETCRTIINEIEDTETNLAAESNEKIKLQLNSLASEVGKINFLCLAPNDEKPNCKFDKSNSHFLYSLTEAIRYCEDQNVGQTSAGNSQNANLSILKMFVQQFRADFNTLIMEIELLKIGESARCEEMNRENVQKFFEELKDIQEDLKENKGFYDEELNRYMKSSISNDQGFCYGDAVEKAKKELAESLEKNKHNNDSDDNVHQILIKMIVKMKCLIYENELNVKTAFLMDEHVNGKGIIAMSEIFRQKFEQIKQLMGDDKGQDNHEEEERRRKNQSRNLARISNKDSGKEFSYVPL
ncbi:hypothetical protein niasHS_015849 [Heterodera schachtii]|uniref:Secreted protein n=1 Tax=Heterodera schachtii TaxID=97005 RepID=A0ABD2HTH8_HETSC